MDIIKLRIGADWTFDFAVGRCSTNGTPVPEDFSDATDLSVTVTGADFQKAQIPTSDIAVTGNIIRFSLLAVNQTKTGRYVVTVTYKRPDALLSERQYVVDAVFEFVDKSYLQNDVCECNGLVVPVKLNAVIDKYRDGDDGRDGYSPYINPETNTWIHFDDQTQQWVDTGIKAIGEKGDSQFAELVGTAEQPVPLVALQQGYFYTMPVGTVYTVGLNDDPVTATEPFIVSIRAIGVGNLRATLFGATKIIKYTRLGTVTTESQYLNDKDYHGLPKVTGTSSAPVVFENLEAGVYLLTAQSYYRGVAGSTPSSASQPTDVIIEVGTGQTTMFSPTDIIIYPHTAAWKTTTKSYMYGGSSTVILQISGTVASPTYYSNLTTFVAIMQMAANGTMIMVNVKDLRTDRTTANDMTGLYPAIYVYQTVGGTPLQQIEIRDIALAMYKGTSTTTAAVRGCISHRTALYTARDPMLLFNWKKRLK